MMAVTGTYAATGRVDKMPLPEVPASGDRPDPGRAPRIEWR